MRAVTTGYSQKPQIIKHMPQSLEQLLETGADNAPALLAPGRPASSFADPRAQCRRTVESLNSLGLGSGDRVAIVLPDGLELAGSFLANGRKLAVSELKAFAGQRLAGFKVPERIVFVAEMPRGATGKLQRLGLAEKLGLT